MTTRTTEHLVTFRAGFVLAGCDGPLPAGTYRVVVDEQEIDGVSVLAYQRIATRIHVPAVSVVSATREVHDVDPDELARALEADHG